MSGFSAIDLTKIAAPKIVETLDFEQVLTDLTDDLKKRDETLTDLLESDPVMKILEVVAYREILLRARINDAAKSVMLAYATDSDLEHLAVLFGVERQLIEAGDDSVDPPKPPRYEDDERLRKRTQLSLEGYSTAGPVGSYIYHSLAASPLVKDVDVANPEPGVVEVTILSTQDHGWPDSQLMDAVRSRLNHKTIRPLTDRVSVSKPKLIRYTVTAHLILFEGPDAEVVRQTAIEKATDYVNANHLLGNDITLSGLYAALHQAGVQRVSLISPLNNIIVSADSAAWCENLTVEVGANHE